MKKKIAELFCGAGGFAEGAKKAGFKHVWGLDNHEDSCKSFEDNQGCKSYCENIESFAKPSRLKKIKEDHGDIDGLLFGFPCNDFSLVGKNEKMEGKFGGLYKYACDVLNFFEPEFFVAENVTSLSKKLKYNSSDPVIIEKEKKFDKEKLENQNYQNFKKIMGDLAKCSKHGYRIYADNYKFEEYGIPQTRHRIILVGFRGDFFEKNNINFEKPKKIEGPYTTCKKALQKIPKWAKHQELTNHDERVVRR